MNEMTWFKSWVIVVVFVLFSSNLFGQSVNCNSPDANTPIVNRCKCNGPSYCYSTDGSMHLGASAVGGGIPNWDEWVFSIDGGAWSSQPMDGYGFSAGNHTIVARNFVTGCQTSTSIYLAPQNSGGNPVIDYIDVINASSCSNNGVIGVGASSADTSGNANFRYRINGGSENTNGYFENLSPGTYTISVSSHNGLCETSQQVTVYRTSSPEIASVTVSPSTSCATPNGIIQINPANTGIDLEYSIDGGTSWQSNPVFTGLAPKMYLVAAAIPGEYFCKESQWVTLGGASPIIFTSVTTTPSTSCAAADGKITINATGGGSTLNYKVQGGQWQTSKTISGLAPGTYTVHVRNSNGSCETVYPQQVQVTGNGSIIINSVNTVAPTTCNAGSANGQITINATGGSGLRYSINGGTSFSTNPVFSNLQSGSYNILVTKSDGSCPVNYPLVTVPPPAGIAVQSVQTVRPSICGALDGAITIVASPAGSYQYSINNGQTFQSAATFSNLAQGSYQIVVKSTATGCIAYHSANPITLQPQTCPEICNDGIDNDGVGGIDNCPDPNCGLMPMQVQVTQTNCTTNAKGTINIQAPFIMKTGAELQPGDVKLIYSQVRGTSTGDRFSFVPLVHLAGGTQLIFTDKNWSTISPIGLISGEGLVQWTAPSSGLAAGTVVEISVRQVSSTSSITTATYGTVQADEGIPNYQNFDSSNPSFDLNTDSDQLFILTGNSLQSGSITFLFGIYSENEDFGYGGNGVPPGLINGVTVLSIDEAAWSLSEGGSGIWSVPAPVIDNTVTYSINGGQTWQSSPTFSNLDPGFYRVLVRKGNCITARPGNPIQIFGCTEICGDGIDNNGDGQTDCNDNACKVPSYTVNAVSPACPPNPTLGRIQINLSATGGGSYEYSIDNRASWHTTPIFENLGAGSYQVSVKRIESGCTSTYSANPITFNLPVCRELCDDGFDNDGDGDIDCEDSDCGVALPMLDLTIVQPTCPFDANNGSLTINGAGTGVATKNELTLAPGDVAITAYDGNPDLFTFVPRVNLQGGTKIIFTDKGWETTPPDLRNAEGLALWTAPAAGVSAGTSITIERTNSVASVGTVLFDEAIPNYTAFDSSNPDFNLFTSGDQLIALCATSFNIQQIDQITFLAAVQANGSTWDADATSDATSALPPGLVEGVSARALGKVGEAYNIPLPPYEASATYLFSIDGGTNFQSDTLFPQLAAGVYEVVIKDESTGCTKNFGSMPVILHPPNCPEICDNGIDDNGNGDTDCADDACGVPPYAVTSTQPGCPPAPVQGSITIMPYGNVNDYQYSIDSGATWQSTAAFTNLNEGTYHIVVKRIASGCTLAYMPLTLQRPTCPEICNDSIDNDFDGLIDCADTTSCGIAPYAISLTQPDCPPNPIYGTISITPYSSETYQYSLNNGATWQDSTVFANVGGGTYRITVRNVESGCVETSDSVVLERPACVEICDDGVDNDFNGLADCDDFECRIPAYYVRIIQPACSTDPYFGKIIFPVLDTFSNYEYSINNGVSWQTLPEFDSLPLGKYHLWIKNADTGCARYYDGHPVSIVKPYCIELVGNFKDDDDDLLVDCEDPDAGVTPYTVQVRQPGYVKGSINIKPSDNKSYRFSIDGDATRQALPVFRELAPGSYNVVVSGNGCVREYEHNPVVLTTSTTVLECKTEEEIGIPTDPENCVQWIPADSLDNPNSSITIARPSKTTTYRLIITDNEGNLLTDSLFTVEIQSIGLSIYPDNPTICETGGSVKLEAITWENNPNYTYHWAPNGESTALIDAIEAGTYSVTVTDETTGCQKSASVAVKVTTFDVIIQEEGSICKPEGVTLTAIPNGEVSDPRYRWSNGATTAQITVPDTTIKKYTVTVTDAKTGCQATKEHTIQSGSLEVEIESDKPFFYPNSSVTLNVAANFATYSWEKVGTSGEIGDTASILISEAGDYSITVTDDNGCTATDQITIKDCTDPAAIRAFLESSGFYGIPITVLGSTETPFKQPALEKSLSSQTLCESNSCDGSNTPCVQDDAKLRIEINGTIINNLADVLENASEVIQENFGYTNINTYVASQDNLCACPDYLDKLKEILSDPSGLHYVVITVTGANGQDSLFILSNTSPNDEEYRAFVNNNLSLQLENGTIGDQILGNLLNLTLGNFLGDNTAQDSNQPPCDNIKRTNPVILTPSGQIMQIFGEVILHFSPLGFTREQINFPNGTVTGFTVYLPDGRPCFYYGRTDSLGNFIGYVPIPIWNNACNETKPYKSELSSTPNPPLVVAGVHSRNEDGSISYTSRTYKYTCSPARDSTTGSGPFLSSTRLDSLLRSCFTFANDSLKYDRSLPPITEANFDADTRIQVDCGFAGGLSAWLLDDSGFKQAFYIAADTSATPDTLYMQRWNCAVGLWEAFTPATPEELQIQSRLRAEHNFCINKGDGIGKMEGEGDSAYDDAGCYQLSKADIGSPVTLTGVPDTSEANILNLVGATGTYISAIENAVENNPNLKMVYIISGDGPVAGGDAPESSFDQASLAFYNYDFANAAAADILMWMHFKKDGSAWYCFKLGYKFFDINIAEENDTTRINLSPAERDSLGDIIIRALLNAQNLNVEDILNGNLIVDLNHPDIILPPGCSHWWYFGIRRGYEDQATLPNLWAEYLETTRHVFDSLRVPRNIWECTGTSILDYPGATAGLVDGILERIESLPADIESAIKFEFVRQVTELLLSIIQNEEERRKFLEQFRQLPEIARTLVSDLDSTYLGTDYEENSYNWGKLIGNLLCEILFQKGAGYLKQITNLDDLVKNYLGKLDGFTKLDPDQKQKLNDKFVELDFDEATENEFITKFLPKLDEAHHKKLAENPVLVDIWAKFRNDTDLDLVAIFQKLPKDEKFYQKFEEVFLQNGTLKDNAKDFLKDISTPGNEALLDLFKKNPDAIKSWEILSQYGDLKIDSDLLENVADYLKRYPGKEADIKSNLDIMSEQDRKRYIESLEKQGLETLFSSNTLNQATPEFPTPPANRNIGKLKFDANAKVIDPSSNPELKQLADDVKMNGDVDYPGGSKTEKIMDIIMNDAGYVKLDGKTGSNNGFDGVYIKESPNNVTEIVIGEAKPWNSGVTLNKDNPTTGLPTQMSDDWIEDVILRIKSNGNNEVGELLDTHKSKIVKIVTTVDKSTDPATIKILKLGSY